MIPNLVSRSVGEEGEGFRMKTFILKGLRVLFPSSEPMGEKKGKSTKLVEARIRTLLQSE